MNFIFKVLIGLLWFLAFSSCSEPKSNEESGKNYADYFYPIDNEIPVIYAYRDDKAPLDERFFRIYTIAEDDSSFLVVEKYNSSFRMFEGYTHFIEDDFSVLDHMMVDKHLIKVKSKIAKDKSFPLSKNETASFIVDFPSHLDSVVMVYESNKTIIEDDIFLDVMGEEIEAIKVRDTLRIHFVKPSTKDTKTQEVVTNNYYAKGIGLVKWGDVEGEINYVLQRILSEEWWEEFAQ